MKNSIFFYAITHKYDSIREKNKNYSIRSFAKKLEVDQSLLSRYMKGQVEVSLKTKNKCLQKLGYSDEDISQILDSKSEGEKYEKVSDEVFNILSGWHYYAILECSKLNDFEMTVENCTKKLGLRLEITTAAFKDLTKHGFLYEKGKGSYGVKKPDNTWVPENQSTRMKRDYQEILLRKSIESLRTDDISLRQHISMAFALNINHLPRLKKRLVSFQREIDKEFGSEGERSDVYQLIINFYPLTARNGEEYH